MSITAHKNTLPFARPISLTVCGKTWVIHQTPLKYDKGNEDFNNFRMLKKAVQQSRSERSGEAYASVRSASERCENAAGGLFQHPAIGPQPISAWRERTVFTTLTSLRRFEWCLELFQTSIGVSERRANFAKERGTSNL